MNDRNWKIVWQRIKTKWRWDAGDYIETKWRSELDNLSPLLIDQAFTSISVNEERMPELEEVVAMVLRLISEENIRMNTDMGSDNLPEIPFDELTPKNQQLDIRIKAYLKTLPAEKMEEVREVMYKRGLEPYALPVDTSDWKHGQRTLALGILRSMYGQTHTFYPNFTPHGDNFPEF